MRFGSSELVAEPNSSYSYRAMGGDLGESGCLGGILGMTDNLCRTILAWWYDLVQGLGLATIWWQIVTNGSSPRPSVNSSIGQSAIQLTPSLSGLVSLEGFNPSLFHHLSLSQCLPWCSAEQLPFILSVQCNAPDQSLQSCHQLPTLVVDMQLIKQKNPTTLSMKGTSPSNPIVNPFPSLTLIGAGC